MKKGLLLFIWLMMANFSYTQAPIISQYYEGASNDKYIEVTNPNDVTIDLNGYYLSLFSNAKADSPSGQTPSSSTALSGMLVAGGTVLFKNGSASNPSYASSSSTSAGACGFNGDDLIIITTSNTSTSWANRVDVIGNGNTWGKDKSFYRNSTINAPNATYTTSEWTQVTVAVVNAASTGTTERLGEHVVSPLPISLVSFDAKKQNESIELNWTTAQEINNDYFTIERSFDGKSFDAIGKVAGAGNSDVMNSYTYADETPLRGVNYYRLKQTDIDGTFTYSDVIAIQVGKNGHVFVAPTFVNETTTVYFDEAVRNATDFVIYNVNGQAVYSNTVAVGASTLDISALDFRAGQYYIKFADATINTLKFVKL